MRIRCGLCVFVICLTVLTSFPVQAADLFGWLRQWEIDWGLANTPLVTAPTNKVTLTSDSNYRDFYVRPLNEPPTIAPKLAINAPLVQTHNFLLGARYTQIWTYSGKGSTLQLYARTKYGMITPFAAAGFVVYKHRNNHPQWLQTGYSSPAIALSAGLQLRPLNNFYLQTSFTYTGSAEVTKHNYSYNGRPVKLPEDYQEPAVIFHPQSTIYVGAGLCFNLLPTKESIATTRVANLEKLISRAVDKDIPSKYRNFTIALVESLANVFPHSAFMNKNAGVYWRSYDNTLVLHLISSTDYLRDMKFTRWMGTQVTTVNSLYEDFEKDVVDRVTENISMQVSKHATIPPRLLLLVEFASYERRLRSQQTLVWDPQTGNYRYVPSIEEELGDYRHYLAKVEMQVNKDEPSGYKVLSVQTYLVPSGKVSALGEF